MLGAEVESFPRLSAAALRYHADLTIPFKACFLDLRKILQAI